MNKKWIKDSHKSANYFRGGRRGHHDSDEKLRLIRILDVIGMFETSWLVFDHTNKSRYGYPR